MANDNNNSNPLAALVDAVKIDPEQILSTLITCSFCTNEQVRNCRKCQRPFCTNHTHKFSPDFCQDCFKNVSVIVDKFRKTVESYDYQNDKVVVHKEECDQFRLDGPDYPFLTMWLSKLTEDETKAVYEFHYFIVKIIEHDNEVRKINNRNLRKPTGKIVSVIKTTETKSRRETKVLDLGAELKKKFPGLPQHVIDSMVAASKGAI
jgi:hypothetical protein